MFLLRFEECKSPDCLYVRYQREKDYTKTFFHSFIAFGEMEMTGKRGGGERKENEEKEKKIRKKEQNVHFIFC